MYTIYICVNTPWLDSNHVTFALHVYLCRLSRAAYVGDTRENTAGGPHRCTYNGTVIIPVQGVTRAACNTGPKEQVGKRNQFLVGHVWDRSGAKTPHQPTRGTINLKVYV